jgi:two-component system, NtrC family, sensor kinase
VKRRKETKEEVPTYPVLDPGCDFDSDSTAKLRNALEQLKQARLVQKVFMDLGQTLSLGISQEKMLAIIVNAVDSLFGEAHYLVQIADPKSPVPITFDSRGPLLPGVAKKIHLTRTCIMKTHLDPVLTQAVFVAVHETTPKLFSGSTHAIHVPLVADNQLFGAVQLESAPDVALGDDDEVLLISLANQAALAIRNQRLLAETAFLKDYLADILENANALILVTDTNRQILVYNRAIEQLLGFPKEQMIGTDLFHWIPTEEQPDLLRAISLCFDGAMLPDGLETHMRDREGDQVQILYHLSAVKNQQGENEGLILVGQDITRVRALERQIIEAEKIASLGKLAAGVVHELNNPLTSISVYADYLAKKIRAGKIDAADVEKTEKIITGANRIQKLTRDLVSYGRPSNEEPEMLQPNDLVQQGLGFCEHVISRYDVRVILELVADLPLLCGNRNQLLQVLINLVSNACQAMEGGGEMMVCTRLKDAEHIVISVSDTGIGIPERDLKKIFEPFFTTKTDGQGTGLGLSIVARIIEHHRGSIEVRSTPGEGTTFDVTLPIRPERLHPQRSNKGKSKEKQCDDTGEPGNKT